MGFFNDIKLNENAQNDKDVIGGFYGALDSGAYLMKIEYAYGITSNSGAKGLVVSFKSDKDENLKQTFWLTSGTAKGGKNTYVDKKGNINYLPGFSQADTLALLTVGKHITELESETKVLNLWNRDLNREMPTEVPMLMELVDKEIIVGILKQTVNKKIPTDSGVYVPTDEAQDINEIGKFFRAKDKLTVAEITAQVDTPVFYDKWVDKNTGVTQNKFKDVGTKSNEGKPILSKPSIKKPTASLFS